MPSRPTCLIEWSTPNAPGVVHARVVNPRKLVVSSGFGAMPRRCSLELYDEDRNTRVRLGDVMRVSVNGTPCFSGTVNELRIDSVDDPVSLVAGNDPSQWLKAPVYGEWTTIAAQTWLAENAPSVGLDYLPTLPTVPKIDAITFLGQSMLAALDLWAKLMGNWRWDITDEGLLHFREWGRSPDHIVHLHRDVDTVNLRISPYDRYESVTLYAGVIKGSEQVVPMAFPENLGRSEALHLDVYARPLLSADGLFFMREAIRQQQRQPMVHHRIDLAGRGESIQPGDTVQFSIDHLDVFPGEQRFRVKRREITIAHETLTTRLHLTTGFESAQRYFQYMLTDPRLVPGYLEGNSGAFQLDVSALDSEAYLDVA